jgi:hypothetical protein
MTFSISSILLLLIGITSQFDTLKNKLIAFSPISPEIINWILFIILILTILNQLVRHSKKKKLKKICDELISSETIGNFYRTYVKNDNESKYSQDYFTDKDVEDFVQTNFCRRRYLKSLAYYFESIYVINDFKSIIYLKNYFINNLMNQKYISIGHSKKMNRLFIVK